MKNISKRLLSLAMVIAMVLSMMPTTVFATDATGIVTYADLKAALEAGGEVKLGDDIAITEMITVPSGVTATLDLNGYKITVPEATDRHIYALNNKGVLTIKDSKGTGSVAARGIYNGYDGSNTEETVAGAKMTIESGTFYAVDTNGGAAIFNCAELVINGGTFDGQVAAVNSRTKGVATIHNGTFRSVNNYAIQNNGGTVTIHNAIVDRGFGAVGCFGGTTTINDGTYLPTGMKETTCHVVYVAAGADVTINDGTFKMNYPEDAVPDSGSAVTSYYNGTLKITGGDFTAHFNNVSPVELSSGSEITGGTYKNHAGEASNHSYVTNFVKDGYELGADGTVSVGGNVVAVVNGTAYETFAEALAAAKTLTGDVTVEIYDKVTLNSSLSGSFDSIKFVGKEADAEVYLDVQGYITATGKKVAFENLTLSKAQGGFITNAGFMNVAFGIYDVAEVAYTNCTFANGAYAGSGKVTYTGCTFQKSWEKYGLWAYGDVDVTVDGCTFDNDRGIKMYAEGAAKVTNLTVKNTDFSKLTGKPAIVLTYGESVALEGNTYSDTGVFELDLDGAPNGTAVTSDVAPVCKNDNGACGVLVDGKIYTTVAQAAAVATAGSKVTLLHDSAETVELAEGVILDKGSFTAAGVTVKTSYAATVKGVGYKTLEEAAAAATAGDTITLLSDVAENVTLPAGITLNGNGKKVGDITAAGEITFAGVTKANSFSVEYTNTTINIGEGACLEITGTGRMVIGHGCTFNITGTITDAKTADKATIQPSLIMPGASFTGAGVTFNVTNAYIKAPSSYCSSSKYASGTFDFNITNSIVETAGKLAFEAQSSAATVNFELKDSVLTTGSHLVFGVSSGEVVIDNSNVNVGTSRQIENRSTMTVKNGSVVNGAVATSSNAKNPGTLIVENATYAVSGEFSGSDLGTGTLIVKKGASFTAGSVTKANIVVDATGMTAGDEIAINANLSNLAGTVEVINNAGLKAEIVDGKIVLVEYTLSGTGTEADPYLINNLEDLLWFQAKVDEQAADGSTQFAGKYFKLTANINLAGINWNPIGSMSGDHGSFKGVFDGGDHTISNLNCQQAGNGLGLFARTTGNAEIKNLTLNNVTVKSTNNSSYVGAVVGNSYASTKITNVHVTGNIDISGRGYIGGISGHGYVVMDNVSVVGEGTISSTFWCAGGILGYGGEGATNIMNAKVEGTGENGLTITSAAGGLGAIVGMAEDNEGTQPISGSNLSAKNVDIKTYTGAYGDAYSNYALGYLYGGNPTSNLTGELKVEDVEITTSNGVTPAVNDAVATVNGAVYFSLQAALDAAAAGTGNVTVEILRNVDLTDVDWNPVTVSGPGYPLVTVNGNNKIITGLKDMLFAGTWAGESGLIINDLTIANSNIVNDKDDAKGTVGVGAFIGYPQASAIITLNNCHLVNSTVEGGHWTGGLIGMAGGYNGNDGPVFMNLTITGCSVTGSTITGKGSVGGVIGHGSCAAWTNVVIEDTTVSGNHITSTGSSTVKAGSVMGTIGAAGQPTTAAGETKQGGAFVSVTTSGNTVTSNGTTITTIYGRQGTETGMLEITGGTYEAYPIEENVSYAAPKADYKIAENADGTFGLQQCTYVAQIGGTKYETLEEAFAAAEDGDTITVLADITYTKDNGYVNGTWVDGLVYTGDKSFTVDFGGHTITDNGDINDYLIYLKNQGEKDNEITFQNGKIVVKSDRTNTVWAAVTVGASSATHKTTLNLNGMEIVNNNPNNANNQVVRVRNGSVVNLNNGTVVTSDGTSYGAGAETGSTLNVNSGAKVVQTNSGTTSGNLVYTAISGNGTINIYDGAVIESDKYGIHNMTTGNAVINIYGGTITAPVTVHASTNGGTGETATVTITGGTFNGTLETTNNDSKIVVSGGSFDAPVAEEFCAEGFVPKDNGDGTYGVKVQLPEVDITDIKDTLSNEDPDLTFALNFAISNVEDLTEEYLNELFEAYGDYYVDYVLTISGLSQESVVFNANGDADGYLAGQYDAWGKNWVAVPFDDVVVNNGQSLYIMEYAAKLMGKQGLRFTLAEVATIVQNFDCGVYFTPEFLAANPNLKVTLDLKVFTEDAEGNKIENIDVATNEFKNDYIAAVTADGKQTKYYKTFAEAYGAAQAGDTVELLKDATLTEKLIVAKAITIDGNGYSIIADENTKWYKEKTSIFGTTKDYYPWALIQANGAVLKNVTIDSNNVAGGVKIENAENVVFDNVSILGAKADALTVVGSLTLKSYLKTETSSTMLDARSGSVTAEPGTVFDMTRWMGNASPATSDLKGVVDTEGNPFFEAYNSTTYIVDLNKQTSLSNVTLLDDVTLIKDFTASGTLNLNGYNLTVADGKALKVSSNLAVNGEGTLAGDVVLTKAAATVEGPANMDVTTTLAGYKVVYEGGVYKLAQIVYVAYIGEQGYETVDAAVKAAKDGDTIRLDSAEAAISMNATVDGGRTITFTGAALVDWSLGNLWIGRNGTGSGKVIFKDATITSLKKITVGSTGIHVSGAKAGSTGTCDGVLEIVNSTIELDYLINRNEVIVSDNSHLTVTGGTYVHGRHAGESDSGTDEIATLTVKDSKLTIVNINGLGIGGESYGELILDNAQVDCQSAFIVNANGTVKMDADSTITAAKLTGNGNIQIDATDLAADKVVITAATAGFEKNITVIGNDKAEAKINADDVQVVIKVAEDVAKNNATGVVYDDLQSALDDAAKGHTVILLTDATADGLYVGPGKTLDLNGKTLTVKDYISAPFKGTHIIDSSNGKGLLDLDGEETAYAFNEHNCQLPLWTEEGVRFVSVTFHQALVFQDKTGAANENVGYFRFYFKELAADTILDEFLANGTTGTGITIRIKVSYVTTGGMAATQYFAFTSEMVKEYVTGEYGWDNSEFRLYLTGVAGLESLAFEAEIVSEAKDGSTVVLGGNTYMG